MKNDSEELEQLSRRYLDLWQDQWSAMVSDPKTAEAMTRFYELIGQQIKAFAAFVPGLAMPGEEIAKPEKSREDHGRAASDDPATPGSTAAAAASDGSAQRVDEFARRLAAIEARLARLDAGGTAAAPARRARRLSRRRRQRGGAARRLRSRR
jgi:uncharacterized membrane protein YccC